MYIECAWVGSKRLAKDGNEGKEEDCGRVVVLVIQLPACTCCCFYTYVYLLFLPLKSRRGLELSSCRDFIAVTRIHTICFIMRVRACSSQTEIKHYLSRLGNAIKETIENTLKIIAIFLLD